MRTSIEGGRGLGFEGMRVRRRGERRRGIGMEMRGFGGRRWRRRRGEGSGGSRWISRGRGCLRLELENEMRKSLSFISWRVRVSITHPRGKRGGRRGLERGAWFQVLSSFDCYHQ